jgi:hypothetical protein
MKLLIAFAMIGIPALAQLDLAGITGTVTDSSGASVARAKVRVRNPDTNFAAEYITNGEGIYSAPLLRPGQYEISVESEGFRRAVRSAITLQVQDKLRVDFTLEVGLVSDSVQVTGSTPLLQSETSSTGTVIDTQKIEQLPLNGRDWLRLASLAPGAVTTYRARDRGFTANGNRSIQNSYLLDGVANVSYMRGLDNRRRDVIHPSVDALDEFKVQTSLYSAELGQSAGAVVNATMKSGTNRFRGSLFEFGRNAAFDARPFFQPAGTNKPRFNQHQFGGTVGGPVRRDKTFFFFNYEGSREANSSPQTATVPSLAVRTGDFGATSVYDPESTRQLANGAFARDPFAGNRIPLARFDPIAAKLIALFPAPNQSGARNFFYNPSSISDSDQINARVDHRLTNSDLLFGRYSQYSAPNTAPPGLPVPANLPVFTTTDTRGIAGSWIHNFGASAFNELRYGYNRIRVAQNTGTPRDDYGIPNSLAEGVQGPPVIGITGLNSLGAQGNLPIDKLSESYQVLDNFTWVHGRHSVKTGFDFRMISPFTNSTLNGKGSFTFNGVYTQNPASRGNTGAAFADYLLGLASNGSVGSRIISDESGKVWAGYVQDDWKITPSLTLNMGVRYELSTPYIEANNRMANFLYAGSNPAYGTLAVAGTNGYSRQLVGTDTNNFAPRFGLAWQASQKTVIRGGYGLFYGQDEGYGVVARMVGNPPFFVSVGFPSDQIHPNLTLSGGFPATAVDPRNAVSPNAVGYPYDLPMPYVHQWGLNIQRELPGQWVLEIGYVGSHGLKLLAARDINQPVPGPGAINPRRTFPLFGSLRGIEPYNSSKYAGLNARLEHRFAHAFTALVSYTWGHATDVASAINGEDDYSILPQNSRDLRSERADASYDIRQRLAANYIYELPFGKGKAFASQSWMSPIVGGWSLAGLTELETGRPFNLTTSRDPSNTGATSRPDRLRSGYLPSDQRTLDHWFDVAAFAIPADFTFGNAARNVLHGPGRVNFDLALHRDFRVRESLRLQFRAEMFNAFNHPQFSDPNGTIGSALAGVISGTITPQRQIQFGLRLAF